MADHIIAVNFPYDSYDFGDGLPVIVNTGTLVSDVQLSAIQDKMSALKPKLRPVLIELDEFGNPYVPPDLTWATHDWVNEQIEALGSGGDDVALAAHVASLTPHPAYDDIPSLVLRFENGLV